MILLDEKEDIWLHWNFRATIIINLVLKCNFVTCSPNPALESAREFSACMHTNTHAHTPDG